MAAHLEINRSHAKYWLMCSVMALASGTAVAFISFAIYRYHFTYFPKMYAIHDILEAGDEVDTISEFVCRSTDPSSWDVTGGPGSIELAPGLQLRVSQRGPMHEKVALMLEQMRHAGERLWIRPPCLCNYIVCCEVPNSVASVYYDGKCLGACRPKYFGYCGTAAYCAEMERFSTLLNSIR
jgi:hypothetical protein